ncbi:MAG: hypothetical protein V4722_16600 [Bacteroidota bacterium]
MKHFLFIGLLLSFFEGINAQVKIGGTPAAPLSSAVLELDGGATRGLLLPRLRKIDMLAIPTPAEGLTVYVTDEQATYLRRQNDWVKLSGDTDAFSLPYFNQFNYGGTAVFGIANTASNGVAIIGQSLGDGYGVRGFTQTGIGVNGTSQNATGIAGYFTNNAGGRALISTGKTGIGTTNPSVLLHIDGSTTTGNTIILNDDVDPIMQFQKLGIDKSYIKQEGNNLVLRPNGQNSSGKVVLQAYNDGGWMFVDAVGNSSFGVDPATFSGTPNDNRMHIKGSHSKVLALESPFVDQGAELTFLRKDGNALMNDGNIKGGANSMEFYHKINGFEWSGPQYGTEMRLQNTSMTGGNGSFQGGVLHVTGRIGISPYTTPEAPLHIKDMLDQAHTVIIDADDPLISIRKSGVDKSFIQQVDDDIKIGTNASNDRGRFIVRTNGSDKLWVDSIGYVTIGGRIGPTLSGPYKLAVKGKIAATDFNVVAVGSWPDYVFADDYKLRTLEETEAFIKVNKHLPNIPAAAVVEKEGIALGDMQKRMMEKIEELTLYLIDSKKEINELKQKVQALQSKR